MKAIFKFMPVAAALALATSAYAAETEAPVWKAVSASDNTTYAIKADGTLWGWGSNEQGELGQGSTDAKLSAVPLQMGTDSDWKAVYGARGCGFFLKEDGSLWTVGSNEKGMSGVGDGITKHTSLVQVGTDKDWASVGTSVTWCYTVLALKTDGTLWAWGSGEDFGLGQGNTNNSAVPIQVGTDNDWKEVSVGASHVLALKNDGSLWGWGFAAYGQLLNEETIVRVPTRIGTDTWEKAIAVDYASYGIKADGSLWAWGDNQTNLLGLDSDMSEVENENDGTLPNIKVPTQITAITGKVSQVSGCQKARVALVEGKIYTWGDNSNGALGDGKGSALEVGVGQYQYKPTEITLPDGVVAASISCGQLFTTLIDNEGVLYGWGANRWGQLGNYVDETRLTFEPSPIQLGVPAPPKPGEYTFDAENIPSSLADAVTIKLTGEWNTSAFQKLCTTIGANLGFPPVGNNKLESVDMSEATFAENTSFYVPAGMQNAGVFKMCKALKIVKFPANETAANLTSLREGFMNCASLEVCDISGLTGVTDITDAFYGTAITSVNMSAWTNVTKSEDAFGMCSKLQSVVLPANFTVGKFLFNSCTSLRLIDWSLYAGETAPVIGSDANVFEHLTAEEQALITVMVPEAVFESFKADATWANVNLQAVSSQEEGVYTINANDIPADLSDARKITLMGLWDTPKFKALSAALGNNASATASNTVLESIDMSKAEIAVATNLCAEYPGVLFGTQVRGIFKKCTALTEVIMPAADQAANFRSFENAFNGCEALTSIDLKGCTGLNNTDNAFSNCSALEKVVLPGSFKFGTETFDRCEALKEIDWTSFEGTEAPAFKMNSLPTLGKALTITVPAAAYDSFVANTSWNSYTIVSDGQSALTTITADADAQSARTVYDFSGRQVTVLAPGQDVNTLPAGLYIVGGRKVLVK